MTQSIRIAVAIVLACAFSVPLESAFGQSSDNIARLGVRVINGSNARTVTGVVVGLDAHGQAITDLDPKNLQATLDGQSVDLSPVAGRPSIALAAAFLLDSAATSLVRDAVANALAEGLTGVDVNRDSVSIVSTSDTKPWDQATFSTSPDDLGNALNQVIQVAPNDQMASLEQVSGALRALAAQQKDSRVLLLFINRPLATLGTVNISIGIIRTFAVENGIQISIVALPGAGGQGPSEAVAEATAGGRVEYALNATNRQDISRRIGPLLAPVIGARRFEFPRPNEGNHTLTVTTPGVLLPAVATFITTARSVGVVSLETVTGPLQAGGEIREPTWLQAKPSENAEIDLVEWSIDGKVTQVTTEPYAILLDPETLGDGSHDITARITSQGRAGQPFATKVYVPTDIVRTIRIAVRQWGLIALLVIGNVLVLYLLLRFGRVGGDDPQLAMEFPPMLRLDRTPGSPFVAPESIVFPTRGKLRIGYHPPYMDNNVGNRGFAKLPYQDVRGDEEAVRDLSRHVACIWRDPKTNDCYIQLGWPGPGQAIVPKPQSQVSHFGKPQDATSQPFRLVHLDEVQLASGITFVFSQVGLRDKATPEAKKLSVFEPRGFDGRSRIVRVNDTTQREAVNNQELAEES